MLYTVGAEYHFTNNDFSNPEIIEPGNKEAMPKTEKKKTKSTYFAVPTRIFFAELESRITILNIQSQIA
jgi:hypothetical protein